MGQQIYKVTLMKQLIYLILVVGAVSVSRAQTGQPVTVFETYESYLQQKGVKAGKFNDFFYSASSFKIISGTGKKKKDIPLKKSWGFMLGDSMLFRMDGVHPCLVVFVTDHIVFYENGAQILNGLLPHDKRHPAVGTPCFLSVNLNTKIKGIPGGAPGMFKEDEKVKEFISCAKWKYQSDRMGIRQCWYDHIEPNLEYINYLPAE